MKLLDQSAKTNWKFIAIVAIVTLLLGGGAWWYGKMLTVADLAQEQEYVRDPAREDEQENETAGPALSEVEGWQTYRNEEFGFEVKYPSDLSMEENAVVRYPDSRGIAILFPQTHLRNTPLTDARINIWVKEKSCRRSETSEDTYRIERNATINQIPFQIATWAYMPPSFGYEYSTQKGDVCYEITLTMSGEDQKLFFPFVDQEVLGGRMFFEITDQILSTFKFLDQEQADPSATPQPVKLAREYLAKQLDTAVSNIEIVKIEEKTWGDGSIGCPKEGFMYTQAIVPGYQVTFKYKQTLYLYNTDKNSLFVQCDKGS